MNYTLDLVIVDDDDVVDDDHRIFKPKKNNFKDSFKDAFYSFFRFSVFITSRKLLCLKMNSIIWFIYAGWRIFFFFLMTTSDDDDDYDDQSVAIHFIHSWFNTTLYKHTHYTHKHTIKRYMRKIASSVHISGFFSSSSSSSF